MPLGHGNSLPMQAGGSPTRFETAYAVLRRLVGRNGSADNDDVIEAQWRMAKADAMAALGTFDERAALQSSPITATDHIPLYEDTLGLVTDTDLSDQQRRDVIVPDYAGVPEAWTSALIQGLQRIDPSAGVVTRPWENSGNCQIGKWYEEFAPILGREYDTTDTGAPVGATGRKATAWPNVSDSHTALIFYDIGDGVVPSREQQRLAQQMGEFANEVLPSWVDFHITYASGFTLDLSRLDATSFGS